MSRVFADSFYFLAMLNRRDEMHDRGTQWTRTNRRGLVTTEWIILELADGLASGHGRESIFRTRAELLADPKHLLIPFEMDLYGDALDLFRRRADKQWSLTDCISFTVMEREGLTDALTGDRHFEQAGFRNLFA